MSQQAAPGPRADKDLVTALNAAGRFAEAGELLRELLARDPLNPDLLMRDFMWRIARGDQSAWHTHEWRHSSPDWMRNDRPTLVPLPNWDGSNPAGKHIVFYGEQGIGDEIMFSSLLPAVAACVGRATLLCEPRLVPLFARSMPAVTVAAKPSGGQPAMLEEGITGSLRCSLSSLPLRAGPQAMSSLGKPCLQADPAAVAHWRARLAALGGRLTVGLSWHGGLAGNNQGLRSIEPREFAPLFALPGVRFANVQYGSHPEAIASLNASAALPLVSFDGIDPLRDMDSFAALLSALDLVISVDNSTVHLAGALGVPTWMPCSWNPDWRWGREGEGSGWYDSVRLFRQPDARTPWSEVLANIGAALESYAPHPSAPQACAPQTTGSQCEPRQPTLLLLNDTTYWAHWGCAASSIALHAGLRAVGHAVDSVQHVHCASIGTPPASVADLDDETLFHAFRHQNPGFCERIAAAAEVVVNGDMHLLGDGEVARNLLYLAWIASRRFSKRVSIINHVACPGNAGELYRRVYQAMHHVAVNDDASASLLDRMGVRATRAFDCLPLFTGCGERGSKRLREKRVVLAGLLVQDGRLLEMMVAIAEAALARGHRVEFLTGAAAYNAPDDRMLAALLQRRLPGRHALITAHAESEWLHALAGASLLVTRRRQHALAAACIGTPCAAIDGGEPMEDLPVLLSPSDIPQATARVMALLDDPAPAMVPDATISHWRELALRSFELLRRAGS